MIKVLENDDLHILETLIINLDLSTFEENFLLIATEKNLVRAVALMCTKINEDFNTPVCKLLALHR
jgi:hypothetical protein